MKGLIILRQNNFCYLPCLLTNKANNDSTVFHYSPWLLTNKANNEQEGNVLLEPAAAMLHKLVLVMFCSSTRRNFPHRPTVRGAKRARRILNKSNFLGRHRSWDIKFPKKSNFLGSQISREVKFSGNSNFRELRFPGKSNFPGSHEVLLDSPGTT